MVFKVWLLDQPDLLEMQILSLYSGSSGSEAGHRAQPLCVFIGCTHVMCDSTCAIVAIQAAAVTIPDP